VAAVLASGGARHGAGAAGAHGGPDRQRARRCRVVDLRGPAVALSPTPAPLKPGGPRLGRAPRITRQAWPSLPDVTLQAQRSRRPTPRLPTGPRWRETWRQRASPSTPRARPRPAGRSCSHTRRCCWYPPHGATPPRRPRACPACSPRQPASRAGPCMHGSAPERARRRPPPRVWAQELGGEAFLCLSRHYARAHAAPGARAAPAPAPAPAPEVIAAPLPLPRALPRRTLQEGGAAAGGGGVVEGRDVSG